MSFNIVLGHQFLCWHAMWPQVVLAVVIRNAVLWPAQHVRALIEPTVLGVASLSSCRRLRWGQWRSDPQRLAS